VQITWTRALRGKDADDYDRFVATAAGGHYAQTRAWENVALASRPCSARYFMAREGGAVVGAALVLRAKAGPLPLPVATIDRGPVVNDPADAPRVLDALLRATRAHGIARLSVMPYFEGEAAERIAKTLLEKGFRDTQTFDGAHVKTLRVEIGQKTDQEIFAGKVRQQVRWRAGQAEKAGARGRLGEKREFMEHRALFAQLMSSQGKRGRSDAWFEALWENMLAHPERGAFFVTEHEAKIVGTVVVLRHGALATYAFGASSTDPVKFTKAIPALVAAIKWARDQGCATFDLGGVPMDGDTDAKRAQIADLKTDFSRTPVLLTREHSRYF
jgi:hypothetical protein